MMIVVWGTRRVCGDGVREDGFAAFLGLYINEAGEPYTIGFSTDLALTGATVVYSNPFAVGIGPAAQVGREGRREGGREGGRQIGSVRPSVRLVGRSAGRSVAARRVGRARRGATRETTAQTTAWEPPSPPPPTADDGG